MAIKIVDGSIIITPTTILEQAQTGDVNAPVGVSDNPDRPALTDLRNILDSEIVQRIQGK